MKNDDKEEVSRTLTTSAPLWIRVPDIGKKYHNEIEAEEDGTEEARDDVLVQSHEEHRQDNGKHTRVLRHLDEFCIKTVRIVTKTKKLTDNNRIQAEFAEHGEYPLSDGTEDASHEFSTKSCKQALTSRISRVCRT